MANTTTNLNLTLPGFGEFTDSWHTPMNDNFSKIDTWAGNTQLEISNARFSKSSLKGFLEVAHNADGTLLPTAEVLSTRNSFLYGIDESNNVGYELDVLADIQQHETWRARALSADLRDALAYRPSFGPSMILSGGKNSSGYPTWHSYSTSIARIDGSAVPLVLMIAGQISRIRTLKSVDLAGKTAATYYVYATFQPDGVQTFTSTAGIIGSDGTQLRVHQVVGKDFVNSEDVKVGDVLRYMSGGASDGDYLIEELNFNGNADQLKIKNIFPTSAAGTHEIRDPLAPTLWASPTEMRILEGDTLIVGNKYRIVTQTTLDFVTAGAANNLTGTEFTATQAFTLGVDDELYPLNSMCIAEVDYDGTSAITAMRPRHFKDSFIGEWRAVDVSGVTPTFTEIYNHNLGTDQLEVQIQASLVNDSSGTVESLSISKMINTLVTSLPVDVSGLTVTATSGNNTLVSDGHSHTLSKLPVVSGESFVVSAPSAPSVAHTHPITGAPVSGSATADLTGTIAPANSVAVKFSKNQIWIKNAVSGLFFRDFSDTDRQTGYVRVIITKKG